ncbi:hypothetical protein K7X08_036396 [Anisodus acutangulus]|uniref:Uncharacterized protein n=1 Tax=Anisodus acutangulus TaxID=402998 RepID=A0A9Q1L6N5_9SOLA|nr:hypothetical protein K7X08_036396 [Anisodus acutangulus]
MAASSASDSSSSSGHRDRKRHGRNRKDKNKDSLKVRKKSRSRTKRRHSSSDILQTVNVKKSTVQKDTYRKIEPQRRRIKRGKSHRQKRHNHKIKEKQVESSGPVQLSKFLGRDNDDGVRLSAVSGKKILLKLDKTKEDKEAESDLICEELPVEMCTLSIDSSGKRCVLESTTSGNEGKFEMQCQTSEVFASNKVLQEYIETDECAGACGVDRQSLGLSSDSLLDSKFIAKLCSHQCYNNCPNIVDLYSNLASAEGVSLPEMCSSQRTRPGHKLLSSGAAAPVVYGGGSVSAAAPPPSQY